MSEVNQALPDYLSKLGVTIDDATATATAETEKAKFDEAGKPELSTLREPMQQILYAPGFAAQVPTANFKVHKVKPGNAKGVLGFQNTTVGTETYTQLVFKPFGKDGKAEIDSTVDLSGQPLLNLNGQGEESGAKERKMTSNMIANIADAAYSDTSKSIEDVKTEWYDKAQNAFKATDGRDVYGQSMKAAKLVGGKSKKRRIQRRKSVRRRRMSNRKR
jgi:hypothetical protein